MDFNPAFWLQIVFYGFTIAIIWGRTSTTIEYLRTDIKRLEVKMDKYNNLQERTALLERSCDTFHGRLDRKGDEINRLREEFHEHCLGERGERK